MTDRALGAEALFDLVTPVVVRVATATGLLERAAGSPHPADGPRALARELGLEPAIVDRLVRFLAVRGVLAIDERGRIAATALGRDLLDRYAARMDWLGAPGRLDRRFVAECLAIVRGEPRADLWAEFDRDPELAGSFDALMSARAAEWVDAVIAEPFWRDVERVADLGGGRGHLLFGLLAAWPGLRGLLVERPGPARAASLEAARLGLAERVEVEVGDLLGAAPTGTADPPRAPGRAGARVRARARAYDLALLAHVLHDWDDAAAVRILRAAGRYSARIAVVERVLPEAYDRAGRDELDATAQDFRLFVLFGGRERTLREFHALADRAGLAPDGRVGLPGCRAVQFYVPRPVSRPVSRPVRPPAG